MESKSTSLREFISIFSRSFGSYKRQIVVLTVLGFVNGLLGGIGVSSVIPLFSFAIGGVPGTDTISTHLMGLFSFFGIPFTLRYIIFFILTLFILKTISTLFATYLNYRAMLMYQEKTRIKLLKDILMSNWQYLLTQKLGHIETVMMKNIEKTGMLLEQTSAALMTMTTIIAYTIIAFNISSRITLSIFVTAILAFAVMRMFPRTVESLSTRLEEIFREIAHHVNESILAMKTIKARGVEGEVAQKARPLVESVTKESLKIRMSIAIPGALLEPISVVLVIAIFLFARKIPGFNIASLAAIVYVIKQIFTYLIQVQSYIFSVREYAPYARVVLSYGQLAQKNKEPEVGTEPFIFKDMLEFRDVHFAYENGKEIFDGLSFSIKKGELVGIIGSSGAGKTTLVDLLLRLFQPKSGGIFLDGVLSEKVMQKEWRTRIGYVPQDVYLLNGTIAQNIRFYDSTITDDAMKEAAKLANIYDFIEELPKKWDTEVGERGVMLSGGQKQRIGIAMALARKPEIVIFDEATSALDNESEAHVKQAMENMRGKVTLIAIAHRLTTVLDADRIITLGDGRVLEEGNPKELMARPDSYLAKMHRVTHG